MKTPSGKRNLVLERAYLHNFVSWVQDLRPRGVDLQDDDNTLKCVAHIVEQVLGENKNPLPKQRGRKRDGDTMWLCFHMVAFPVGCRVQLSEAGFDAVASQLNLSGKGVEANYYKALRKLDSGGGRDEYTEWLIRREKRWASFNRRDLKAASCQPREYVISCITTGDKGNFYGCKHLMICARRDQSGEEQILSLSSKDQNVFLREAEEQFKSSRGKADHGNWAANKGRILQISLYPKNKRRQ